MIVWNTCYFHILTPFCEFFLNTTLSSQEVKFCQLSVVSFSVFANDQEISKLSPLWLSSKLNDQGNGNKKESWIVYILAEETTTHTKEAFEYGLTDRIELSSNFIVSLSQKVTFITSILQWRNIDRQSLDCRSRDLFRDQEFFFNLYELSRVYSSTTYKVESFAGRNFRAFKSFLGVRESWYPRNRTFIGVHEILHGKSLKMSSE